MKSEPTSLPLWHRRVKLTECSLHNENFHRLYRLFRLTICPGMSEKVFEAYYASPDLDYIDVSFFYTGSGAITGFSAAAFYRRMIGGRLVVIARSATGTLPDYQGGTFNKIVLYAKYMRYKLRHPQQRMILTIFASNPFVYHMVCKYTGVVYPRYNQPVPQPILALKKDILESSRLQRRERQPFVIKIHFEVEKTEALRQQAAGSTSPHVRFFVQQTGLQQCLALLLIVPVTFGNISSCLWLLLWHYLVGKTAALWSRTKRELKVFQNRLSCWLHHPRQAGYANKKTL